MTDAELQYLDQLPAVSAANASSADKQAPAGAGRRPRDVSDDWPLLIGKSAFYETMHAWYRRALKRQALAQSTPAPVLDTAAPAPAPAPAPSLPPPWRAPAPSLPPPCAMLMRRH